MRLNWILVPICSAGLLAGCSSETEPNTTENSAVGNDVIQEPATGPDFDLLTTPVGDVSFPTTCTDEAGVLVERGVALMHNMMYPEADFVFSMADDQDPNCAMAYWGQAMVQIHPLWGDALSEEQYARGLELTRRGQSIEGISEREKNYLLTTEVFYQQSEGLNMRAGFEKMSATWADISAQMPDDKDAQAFNALFKIAISSNDPERMEAGQIALDILNEMPNHPGGHHYVIHAFDTAELAPLALETANHYGEITPKVPHASHMMTHTFTRLGEWDSAIEWNNISADSALELCIVNGEINSHYPHAMDYLVFAHLQKGDDAMAAQVEQELFSVEITDYEEAGQRGIAYAYTAVPARMAMERKDWERAITLQPKTPEYFPWNDMDKRDIVNTHFARAIGFSMLDRPDEADTDIAMIQELIDTLPQINGYNYYKMKMRNQLLGAKAWQQFARGNIEDALTLMSEASEIEAKSENAPTNPGDILPSEEMLGDMYLKLDRLQEAHEAYVLSLARSPGRFNSIYGAAMTAHALGDEQTARRYFTLLLANVEGATSTRPIINDVRNTLAALNRRASL